MPLLLKYFLGHETMVLENILMIAFLMQHGLSILNSTNKYKFRITA